MTVAVNTHIEYINVFRISANNEKTKQSMSVWQYIVNVSLTVHCKCNTDPYLRLFQYLCWGCELRTPLQVVYTKSSPYDVHYINLEGYCLGNCPGFGDLDLFGSVTCAVTVMDTVPLLIGTAVAAASAVPNRRNISLRCELDESDFS